jgi:hypothetical protein
MSQKKKTKSGILSDHTKVGKVFKPPLMELGELKETSWVKGTLPELLWIGLILEHSGLRNGVDLCLTLAREAQQVQLEDQNSWFAATSSYTLISSESKNVIRRNLSNSNKLLPIRKAISSLVYFYPECPLAFLFEDFVIDLSAEREALTELKEIIASMYSKRDRLPVLVQAQGVYIALVAHKLRVPEGSEIANLEAVTDYPDTEESLRVGASVCATCNMLIGMILKESSSGWSDYFWQRGFEIDDCEYQLPYEL